MTETAVSPIKLSLAQMPPEIEGQLYNDYLRPLAGQVITKLYDYVAAGLQGDKAAKELQGCVPLLGQAVQTYQSGDYGSALQQAYAAYRFVTVIRSHRPDLPAIDVGCDDDHH
jgi:hypothetical protein